MFTYNEVLQLSSMSKDTPLFNMAFNPNVVGMADATRVKIRLTDLFDEENYITLCLNNIPESWANGHIYMTAGAAASLTILMIWLRVVSCPTRVARQRR